MASSDARRSSTFARPSGTMKRMSRKSTTLAWFGTRFGLDGLRSACAGPERRGRPMRDVALHAAHRLFLMASPRFAMLCFLLAWGAACSSGVPAPSGPPTLDADVFRQAVYPVMLRDCGFPACHASTPMGLAAANDPNGTRDTAALRVTGPGRLRLARETPLNAPPTDAEIEDARVRATGLVYEGEDCDASPLLRKPLEVDEGGAPHHRLSPHFRDTYRDKDVEGYRILQAWVCTQQGGGAQ